MRKILFFLIVFLISAEKSFSNTNKPTTSSLGCSSEFGQGYLKNIDKLKIKKIEINVHNYRKWIVNGIRIITSRYRYVADKYKKRFNSTIVVMYENDTMCVFEGSIRHSGDEKDHIDLLGN